MQMTLIFLLYAARSLICLFPELADLMILTLFQNISYFTTLFTFFVECRSLSLINTVLISLLLVFFAPTIFTSP
jgi:hypothetical protein